MKIFYSIIALFFLFIPFNGAQNTINNLADFNSATDAFYQYYSDGKNVDYASIKEKPQQLEQLIQFLGKYKMKNEDIATQKAFYLNAYNLLIINQIASKYPIFSVKNISKLFTHEAIKTATNYTTLTQLEKTILQLDNKPTTYFGLMNGTKGGFCKKIQAFFPKTVEQQLVSLAKIAADDPDFVRIDLKKKKCAIPDAFMAIEKDFEKEGGLRTVLNRYRKEPIHPFCTIEYYPSDWALNDVPKINANAIPLADAPTKEYKPFFISQLFKQGVLAFRTVDVVNTQLLYDGIDVANRRSTTFNSANQFLYGVTANFNVGLDFIYRSRVASDEVGHSPLKVFGFERYAISDYRSTIGMRLKTVANHGLSHVAAKIKFKPFKFFKPLTLQQAFLFPINKAMDGRYISNTQFLYDKMFGKKQHLFLDLAFILPISPKFAAKKEFIPTLRAFYYWYPLQTKKLALFASTNVPMEYGGGLRWQFIPNLELELASTYSYRFKYLLGETQPRTFTLAMRYGKKIFK